MIKKSDYIRTDLAFESEVGAKKAHTVKEDFEGISLSVMTVDSDELSALLKKQKGQYITINIGNPCYFGEKESDRASRCIAKYIKQLAAHHRVALDNVMVVGLGNRMMTADALGPLTVDKTVVTRHIREQDPALFRSVTSSVISAISPGVVGQTGIETAELVLGAAERAKPDLVILIDALAARSCDRLGTTVQLSSSGICPGSGVGNRRYSIDRDTLGIPVITVGVPMVVDSSTLVCDVLWRAGIENISDEISDVLKNGQSFFVCLRDSDSVAEKCASIIADALNIAFKNDGLS